MISKEEFKYFIEDAGYLLRDILLRRVSIQRIYYPRYSRSKYNYAIGKYQKAGLIKPKERKKYGNSFVLTDKGRSILKSPTVKKTRGDGLSTIIMFDIPEDKHKERNTFRRYLIRNGYVQFQKSALISPWEISAELKDLIDELKLKSYIKIISGKVNYL